MIKILTIIGARPQIIKAAAISRAISHSFSDRIEEKIVHTGQHYDEKLSQVFFDELDIPKPHYNLGIGSGPHGVQTAGMIVGIEELLIREKADYLLVYGDTNSTLAGAIAASKLHVPVIHIEAGLRSFNRKMPEEVNRILCDHVSSLLFSPTKTGYDNLVKEGFDPLTKGPFDPDHPGIFHCGDIMYDNSIFFSEKAKQHSKILEKNKLLADRFILATVHRDHNTDKKKNLHAIFLALLNIARETPVVLPLHPRTLKKLQERENKKLYEAILNENNLLLLEPVSFLDMIQLEKNAKLVITDSGGVQKEAYFFGKKCIILRPQTEWVEILETGQAILASADQGKIEKAYKHLVKEGENDVFPPIFGDGKAAAFICDVICHNH